MKKLFEKAFPFIKERKLKQQTVELLNFLVQVLPEGHKKFLECYDSYRIKSYSEELTKAGFISLNSSVVEKLEELTKKKPEYKIISGVEIFSTVKNKFVEIKYKVYRSVVIEININDRFPILDEYDLSRLDFEKVRDEELKLEETEALSFYEKIPPGEREKINLHEFIEIDYDGKQYFTIYDLEDGNYIAIDKSMVVYSLVHDAEPPILKIDSDLKKILNDIESGKFNEEEHLDLRYSE